MTDIDPPVTPKLEWSSSEGITHAVLRCYGADRGRLDRLIGEFMDECEPIVSLDVRELDVIYHCDLFGLIQLGRHVTDRGGQLTVTVSKTAHKILRFGSVNRLFTVVVEQN
jgi:hypothetical protein